MKFDRVKTGKVIADIRKYGDDLAELKFNDKGMSKLEFYSSSMLIFSIVNSYMDLANELISSNQLGYPATYADMFDILFDKKIINKKENDAFKRLINIRNAIAHRYFNITLSDVYNAISDLKRVNSFLSVFN
ncbi:MAG: DUF86 domain-containing protein [Candidatus Parvarchaeota archaeon]|jgi:uncharacterized protein YutE (UPF0331/DUF86 family)|nr:DUF86 domain-containing protein [Candidatus Parvarchaeota archaeon]